MAFSLLPPPLLTLYARVAVVAADRAVLFRFSFFSGRIGIGNFGDV